MHQRPVFAAQRKKQILHHLRVVRAGGGTAAKNAVHIKKQHDAVLHRRHIVAQRLAVRGGVGLPEHLPGAKPPQNAAAAPIIVPLDVQASLYQNGNFLHPVALPEHVRALGIAAQPGVQAVQHGGDARLLHTGKHGGLFQNGKIFFHGGSFVVKTTDFPVAL